MASHNFSYNLALAAKLSSILTLEYQNRHSNPNLIFDFDYF
jgi:hypothetical protein